MPQKRSWNILEPKAIVRYRSLRVETVNT
ncbi:hypothetical protein FRAHR75_1490004 [Frankia sp. Hr75.2]|nr:hypothetical protein FRAHR75_1490004 [Frankia sp. Hr75.2]